ncbi:MAG: chemotaxis protein CheA [Candidatus Eisenbacteria bacterium]|uniref:histidine kinase n=1 Tax=Eiseniibacteriota bacterium TaxID=2212470 RepID=A0A538TU09_UNCEI|nr:MAG: chemotaxis protein CheA [Candidatus Eisenbacteria bacterium]
MDESIVNEFIVESHESLNQIEGDLVALERDPSDRKKVAGVFRAVHTIKGTCGFFGFTKLESVAHAGEDLLSQLRSGDIAVDAEIAGVLLTLVDALREILTCIERTRNEGKRDYSALIAHLRRLQRAEKAPETPAAAPDGPNRAQPAGPAPPPGTIGGGLLDSFVESGRLDADAVMLAAQQQRLGDPRRIGEILVDHGALKPQDILEALIARGETPSTIRDGNIRVDVHVLDLLMNLVGELVLARNQMVQYVASKDYGTLPATTQRLNVITTELQEGIMRTRMQPIANLCNKLPRLVRDLAAACGREVRLEMDGIDTELDRTVIEAIRDPLTHLVRNAIDHGIEAPEERAARGKPVEGILAVRAFHEGGKVILEVSDDGGGLDVERIRERALHAGLVPPDRVPSMTDRDWVNVIFTPGFSTADRVTSVSGRGVGMDVVRTNVERIGGTIDVESTPGAGTTMKICIPLTLAIIPALLVSAGGERYAIPQVNLLEVVRAHIEDIASVYDAQVYRYREILLPLVFLRDTLEIGGSIDDEDTKSALHIAILSAEGVTFGLVVDEILSSQEIVVKPLADSLKQAAAFSGATILGDGRVALILDVPGLARHSGVAASTIGSHTPATRAPIEPLRDPAQTLVLFRIRDNWRVAIPLSGVARLEELAPSSIERVGAQGVVQYRGGLMPLLPLLGLLEPGAPDPARAETPLQVVVHESGNARVGLVVDEILELVEDEVAVNEVRGRPGVIGSSVIRGRATDLLDVRALLAHAGVPGFAAAAPEGGARP